MARISGSSSAITTAPICHSFPASYRFLPATVSAKLRNGCSPGAARVVARPPPFPHPNRRHLAPRATDDRAVGRASAGIGVGMTRWTVGRLVAFGYVLAMLVTAALGGSASVRIETMSHTQVSVEHSYQVLDRIAELRAQL